MFSRRPTMEDVRFLTEHFQRFYSHFRHLPKLVWEPCLGTNPDPDVHCFVVVELPAGMVRAGVMYERPGRDGSAFIVGEMDRADAPRWLSQHGVPIVRIGGRTRKENHSARR